MKTKTLASFVLIAALALLLTYGARRSSAANTLVVDNDNVQCPDATYSSIQSAVWAANSGDTIKVCAGTYNEDVFIGDSGPSNLTLNGARADLPYGPRAFGDANESKINGTITIRTSGDTINGFSLTKTATDFGVYGIHIEADASNTTITNNIFDTIVNQNPATGTTAQAIYLQGGPDNVRIEDNKINNVQSSGSAKGVLVGDNGGTGANNPSTGLVIEGNSISDVTSTRGAYGISVAKAGGTQHTGMEIRDNNIKNLTGSLATSWAHAVGLEGDTPGVVVEGNCFSSIVAPGADRIAVWFESNPSYGTAQVHQNNFDVTPAVFGIAVHPALFAATPSSFVNGTNNWWGSATGPTAASNAGGAGAKVSPGVTYIPWLVAPPLGGACGGVEATNANQCKNNGWKRVFRANGTSFKNQGDCIQYVNAGK
jgi:hypothetical protein